MKKYFTPLFIVFGLEAIIVALAATGLIPREAILVWTGLAVFYIIFSPVDDSLWLVIASVPLAAALPLSDTFDTLANWRILIGILFLCLLFKEGLPLKIIGSGQGSWRVVKEGLTCCALGYLAPLFLLVGALSIFAADYKILAIKKLLFLINIFLLFLITRRMARTKESIRRVWQAAAVGGAAAITVAAIQFFSVLFLPLIDFWQFWASRVIDFFYGRNLAELLSYANTWFAYYQSAPPTLRLFSVFPDSHSFAMFSLILLPVFLGLAVLDKKRKKLFWLLAGLAIFGAIFSGSRGVWISSLPVILAALYFWFKEQDKTLLRQALWSLGVFVLVFFASNLYPAIFYKVQAWQTGQYSSSTVSFFERAKSISDLDETSNKGRLEIWRNSLASIARKPMLGVGLGNFISVIKEETDAAKKGASAHNLYLDIAAETGLAGLAVLLAMFADILYTAWLVWRRSSEEHFKFFGLMFGLSFIWILGYGFFDVVLLNDKVLLFFMVSAATLYSLRMIIRKPEKI